MEKKPLHYYVINLPQSQDRKERLVKRLQYHNILDRTTFINAIDGREAGELLDWFEQGSLPKTSSRPEHACFLSHIKALRAFVVDDKAEEAIILEDDAVLCNNFSSRLKNVLEGKDKLKSKPNLILLCFLAASWNGVNNLGIFNEEHFFSIASSIYGGVAYWMTKDYARTCLHRMDKPLRMFSERFVTSELITRLSGGCFITPPLVIEESIYSTLREGNDLDVHRKYFSSFGLENYAAADEEDIKSKWK